MDTENGMSSHLASQVQVDNAIRAIQQKKPPPEIDFTIHTMEDGTQVSTLERVCKGKVPYTCERGSACGWVSRQQLTMFAPPLPSLPRRASTCHVQADQRAVF